MKRHNRKDDGASPKAGELERRLLDASPDPILLVDRSLKVRFANLAARGLVERDLEGAGIPEFACGDAREAAHHILKRAIESGEPGSYETSYELPDGDRRHFELRVHAIQPAQSGEAESLVVIARDVTPRKEAERAAAAALEAAARDQRLLLSLSEAARTVQQARDVHEVYQRICTEIARLGYDATVFHLSDDGKRLEVGYLSLSSKVIKAAESLIGVKSERYAFDLAPGSFFERLVREGTAVFNDPGSGPVAEALPKGTRRLAGRLAKLLGLDQAIYAPLTVEGRRYGLLTVLGSDLLPSDVPAIAGFAAQMAIAIGNAQAYEETRRQRDRAQQYLDVADVILVALDREGRITLVNRKGCELLGRPEAGLLGAS